MKNFRVQSYIGAAALSLLFLASSCNKDFDKVIPDSPENVDSINFKAPKVLYIIADGARGTSVRDAESTNIKSLLPHAIYSWNSLADLTENNATNWADMMTGVKKEKHKVLTPDFAGNKLSEYPVIFQRLKTLNPKMRIASFASSSDFKDKLTGGADVSEAFASDDLVKNRMVDFLKSDTASIVVGEFSGIQKAGETVGYDNKFPAYLAAINTFDAQVGELLNSIKSRPSYARENWLIIITSNRGGKFTLPADQDDKTLFSNTNANTFTIFATPTFKQTFIGKPFLGNLYTGKAVRFKGDPERSVGYVTNAGFNAEYYNFGTDKDFTVSVKIKKGKPKNTSQGDYWYQWPSILGKRDNSGWGDNGNKPGWDISLFYNGWRCFMQGGEAGGFKNGEQIAGYDFSGDTWHDLTFTVEKKADGRRYLRMYTDGVNGIVNLGGSPSSPLKEWQFPGNPNFDNSDRLRLGFTTGEIDGDKGYINIQLSEFKIWRKALSEAVIKQYACDPTMDESHPDYPFLVGYWPMIEGTGDTFVDKSPVGANFTMQGVYAWEEFNALICTPSNTNIGTLVPKNSDIPTQILSWFNIARQETWGLDGRVWISN